MKKGQEPLQHGESTRKKIPKWKSQPYGVRSKERTRSLFQVDYGISGIKSRFRGVGLGWGNPLRIEDGAPGNLQVKMKDKMRHNKDKRGSQKAD